MKLKQHYFLIAVLAIAAGPAFAVEFEWSGYGSVVAGRAVGGDPRPLAAGANCPCEVASYTHGTLYENQWSLKEESRVGLQGRAHLGPNVTFTGQITSHGGEDGKPKLDIFSLRWNSVPAITLTGGRQRLPMFAYSNYIEIGHAYPWVRVPQLIYGWGIENYDGAELLSHTSIGEVDFQVALYGGGYNDRKSSFLGVYDDRDVPRIDKRLKWSNIRGAWATAQWGDLEVRVGRQRFDSQQFEDAPGGEIEFGDSRDETTGMALNYLSSTWVFRSESLNYKVKPRDGSDPYKFKGYFVGAGYQFGRWLPMLTAGTFKQGNQGDKFTSWYASVRYDLNRNVALKAQYEQSKANFDPGAGQNNKLLLFALDASF